MEYHIGVDIGGTKILIGLVDDNGNVTAAKRFEMNRTSQEAAVKTILESIDDFMSSIDILPNFIGVGIVGHIDYQKGIWISSMNIPIHSLVRLATMLEKKYGVRSRIDNDVHCATIAELFFGAGRRSRNFIYINIGTGISAGVVCDGNLIRGADNYAGEFGHMSVGMTGGACICGRTGCVESLASGKGIVEQASREPSLSGRGPGELTSRDILELARQGDPAATETVGIAVKALGSGIANLVNLLNPEEILLGGSVVKNEPDFVHSIWNYVELNALPISVTSLQYFGLSNLDVNTIGVLGASSLCKL